MQFTKKELKRIDDTKYFSCNPIELEIIKDKIKNNIKYPENVYYPILDLIDLFMQIECKKNLPDKKKLNTKKYDFELGEMNGRGCAFIKVQNFIEALFLEEKS